MIRYCSCIMLYVFVLSIVFDCVECFENKGLFCFLYGELMGGVVVFKVLKNFSMWDGVIFVVFMCKIVDFMIFFWYLVKILIVLVYIILKVKFVFFNDIVEIGL